MNWSGWQQIGLLAQCVPCGVIIGLVFEINSGLIRCDTRKPFQYCLDGIFGVIAAILTFFCALVLMDGQLHPVLFLGVLCGFLMEHFTIGRFVEWGIVSLSRFARKTGGYIRIVFSLIFRGFGLIFQKLKRYLPFHSKFNDNNA